MVVGRQGPVEPPRTYSTNQEKVFPALNNGSE